MSSAIHQPVRVRVTAAVLLTLILCLPWLTTLSERISPISYASEALGYRYFHISNAYTTSFNPGVDNNVFYVGYSFLR